MQDDWSLPSTSNSITADGWTDQSRSPGEERKRESARTEMTASRVSLAEEMNPSLRRRGERNGDDYGEREQPR